LPFASLIASWQQQEWWGSPECLNEAKAALAAASGLNEAAATGLIEAKAALARCVESTASFHCSNTATYAVITFQLQEVAVGSGTDRLILRAG
jgi:hypothetical protein